MRANRLIRTFLRWDRQRQYWTIEAVALLAVAAFATRFLPFATAVRSGASRLGQQDLPPGAPKAIADSVARAARHVPWRAVCFQQGLALQRMLRRRGIDARLHYGIGHDAGGALRAHVWIAAGEDILIGGETHEEFRTVAVIP